MSIGGSISRKGIDSRSVLRSRSGRRIVIEGAAKHFFLITFLIIIFMPFLWTLSSSFKNMTEIVSYPPRFIPSQFTLQNYINIFSQTGFLRYILNSIIVTFFTVILTLIASLLAGYAAARYEFPGKQFMMFFILAGMAIGRFAIIIPIYFLSIKLHIYDTYIILILTYSAFITPLVTWLMQSYIKTIPPALEEAAKIDGCNPWSAFWRIILPIMKPPIIAGAVIAMVTAWNEPILAMTLTKSASMRTLPVGLSFYLTEYGVDWGSLTAASIISIIPIIIVFIWLQNYFIQGLTSGTLAGN
ncbi:MAG: carbohydrate ABC transporter permease [Candidatus Humimicrobiaceae bacterium]